MCKWWIPLELSAVVRQSCCCCSIQCGERFPASCLFFNLFHSNALCILFLITPPKGWRHISTKESAGKLHTYESNTLFKHLDQPKRRDEATWECCPCVYKTILVSHWCFDRACTINLHKDSIFAYTNPTSGLLWIWFICSAYVYYCVLWFIFCVKRHQ